MHRKMTVPSLVCFVVFSMCCPALHGGEAGSEPSLKKPNPFFAFCMDTHDSKKRNLGAQAQMLKDLGYAGCGHLWLKDLPERIATLDRAGLKLFQVYLSVNIAPKKGKPCYDPGLRAMLPLLKGRNVMLALLVNGLPPSDPAGDARAVKIIREIADMAAKQKVRIALYHHVNHWLETVGDAARIAKKVDRPNVGVMFNLCHWLKKDGKHLEKALSAAKPRLFAVSINGTDTPEEVQSGKGNWLQPLDRGSYDLRPLLKILKNMKYKGPVGLQCYGIPGDARVHLKRSLSAWRKLNGVNS